MRKTETLAYTAGIIDGEGSICIQRGNNHCKSPSLKVFVTNTEEWICEWLKFQYGGCSNKNGKPPKENWKLSYRWIICANQALVFLELILPYLNLKRPQAELAIKFQRSKRCRGKKYSTDEEMAVQQAQKILMNTLNKRGI